MAVIDLSEIRLERSVTVQSVERAMSMRFLVMCLRGRTKATHSHEFFGFAPKDVAEMHHHKSGVGGGLLVPFDRWSRL